MKRYILFFFLLASVSGYAQQTINNFKYVLVPERFSFQKQNNQYSLSSLTKGLLEDKGFTVYYDNTELPIEIASNKCKALNADLLEKKGMFTTGITLVLKDCQGNVIFKSKEGKSREKEFSTAYNFALRDAFTALDATPYAYQESSASAASVVPATDVSSVTVPATTVTTVENVPAASKAVIAETKLPVGTLYAQATANGFQLIDTAPKIVLTLLKTSAPDYYIANNDKTNGIVLKNNGEWFFEYYKEGKLIAEKLLIKF